MQVKNRLHFQYLYQKIKCNQSLIIHLIQLQDSKLMKFMIM